MSKSDGNYFTLRDLLLRGHKASAIRYLLISVPYHHQLNFTFDGLNDATAAVEKLRTFAARIGNTATTGAEDAQLAARIAQADADFIAALADDLNTARALAPIFDLLRLVNAHLDRTGNTLGAQNLAAVRALLARFDSIFAVIEDRDAAITRSALAWAEEYGRSAEVSTNLAKSFALTDADIDALLAERAEAKLARNFARADAIRNQLTESGILIEDSKDGARWKRK